MKKKKNQSTESKNLYFCKKNLTETKFLKFN